MSKSYNFIFILLILIVMNAVCSQNQVLILNSYHQGFKWTDDLVTGITESVGDSVSDTDFIIHYMDSKRFPIIRDDTGYYRDYLKKRYSTNLDMVITTDNTALDFILKNYHSLFTDIPVVFCGYNFSGEVVNVTGDISFPYSDSGINLHGVIETPRLEPTLNLIRQLQPGVNHIYIIADDSVTGSENLKTIENSIAQNNDYFRFSFLQSNHMSWQDMSGLLGSLSDDSAVFYLDYFSDNTGRYYSPDYIVPRICRASSVPVYTHVDLYMDYGPIGGDLNRGRHHGNLAGGIASGLFSGSEEVRYLVFPSPTTVMLDHSVLKRFGIPFSRIPEGAFLINEPPSFLQMHQYSILTVFILVSLLSVFFIVYSWRIRVDNTKLIEKQRQFRAVFEGVNEAIFILDSRYEIIIDVNGKVQEIFGYSPEDMKGRNFQSTFNIYLKAELEDGTEYEIFHKEGFLLCCSLTHEDIYIDEKPFHMIALRNITEVKQYQMDMERSLKDKNILLQEVHHRVKNNFQIISSLFNLQIEKEGNEVFEKYIREPANRIEAMAQTHQFLYRNHDITEIMFSDYLYDLISRLEYSYNLYQSRISIVTEFDGELVLSIDQAILCGLILNELITNCIKYAFPDSRNGDCLIQVRLIEAGSILYLSVEDNGIGHPCLNDKKSEIEGLGLSLVSSLSEQLGGSFTMTSENGVKSVLEFSR